MPQAIATPTIRPFGDGTQFADWTECNCNRCTKGVHRLADDAWPTCELEAALTTACFDTGEITLDIAKRIGMRDGEERYVWPCNEVEWTEEWKAEYHRRKEKHLVTVSRVVDY
jgi:hypothetical protein